MGEIAQMQHARAPYSHQPAPPAPLAPQAPPAAPAPPAPPPPADNLDQQPPADNRTASQEQPAWGTSTQEPLAEDNGKDCENIENNYPADNRTASQEHQQ